MLEALYLLGLIAFLLLLVVVPVVLVVHAWYMQRYTTPFVPSRNEDIEIMLRSVPVIKGTRVLDVGSGTGEVMVAFAKQGAQKVTGIEINPILLWISAIRLFFTKIPNSSYLLLRRNFLSGSLPQADVVIMYLMPEVNAKMATKLEKELPGALVIANRFDVENWQSLSQEGRVRVYRVPERESSNR